MGQGYPLPCPLFAFCGPSVAFLCCLWMQAAGWVRSYPGWVAPAPGEARSYPHLFHNIFLRGGSDPQTLRLPPSRPHTRTYTRLRKHARAHTHTHLHTRACTRTRMMHTHGHARAHAPARAHTHGYAHTGTHTRACACLGAWVRLPTLPFFVVASLPFFAAPAGLPFPSSPSFLPFLLHFLLPSLPSCYCCTCCCTAAAAVLCTVLSCCTLRYSAVLCATLRSGPALIRRVGIPCEVFGPSPADSFLIPLRDTLIG